MKTPYLFALHGPAGAGKTTVAKFLMQRYPDMLSCNIKDSFSAYAKQIFAEVGFKPENNLKIYKKLQLDISTAGEELDPKCWSDKYVAMLKFYPGHVVTDDIRTTMNLDALQQASITRSVILIVLNCPFEIRNARVSVKRDPNNYTEQYLSIPKHHKYVKFELDTSGAQEDTFVKLLAKLEELGI